VRALRALPALIRIGIAETVAYRAEFVVWMLTTTMPLVMLALWTAVARETPIPGFGATQLSAYYLATLVVRQVTGNWIVWELNFEIRLGTLSMRLLRPLHPLVALAAEHLAAVPLRSAVAAPVVVVGLVWLGAGAVTPDPVLVAMFFVALGLAWLLNFLVMALLGLVALYTEQSLSVFDVFLGVFGVFSGYLIPLELFPEWVRGVAAYLPFRYMLGFPVELVTGRLARPEALAQLGAQVAYVAGFAIVTQLVWKHALRRFEAFGG
jgi:ABC-2 type transport system permease protein